MIAPIKLRLMTAVGPPDCPITAFPFGPGISFSFCDTVMGVEILQIGFGQTGCKPSGYPNIVMEGYIMKVKNQQDKNET